MNLRTGAPFDEALDVRIREGSLAHRSLVGARQRPPRAREACRSPARRPRWSRAQARLRRPAAIAHRSPLPRDRAPSTAHDRHAERPVTAPAPRPRAPPAAPPCPAGSGRRSAPSAFRSSITAAIAVLKVRRRPMSTRDLGQRLVHLAANVALRRRRASSCRARGAAPPLTCACTAFHSRLRKRNAPSTPSSDHSSVCSGGEANIMKSRAVSAPYFATSASGSTPFYLRLRHRADAAVLDRLAVGAKHGADARAALVGLHLDVRRVEIHDAAGGGLAVIDLVQDHALRQQVGERLLERGQAEIAHHARPEPRVQQVQDRVLDAADVLVDGHPVVRAAVDHRRVVAGAGVSGRNTRTSRRRCPSCPSRAAPARPQRGQRHSTNDASFASGLPLPSGTRFSGSTTGRSSSGTGTSPQVSQWISGIGQPQ